MRRSFLLFLMGLCLSVPALSQETDSKKPALFKPILDHLASLTTMPLPDWRVHDDIPHPEDPSLSDSSWQHITANPSREDNDPNHWKGARVLRRWVEIPTAIHGYSMKGAKIRLDLNFGSDAAMMVSIFVNGSLVSRASEEQQQPILLTGKARPGDRFLIAARIDAKQVDTAFFRSDLLIEPAAGRPDPSLIREEVLSALPLIAAYPEGKEQREQQLSDAVHAIDFSPLAKGNQSGFDQSLHQAQVKLEVLRPWMQQFTIRAVGNSHIDMAWLWPWTETVEVVRNTFRSVLDLMREYPDFKFTMSSARAYEWMEEKYPDLFDEIEQRVKEGRWEVIGGMWVEPDLNMPAGESLVRQILVGKTYFRQKFGVDVKIGWNPDSFGYNWQLPQIYKRSGIDYFVTQKLLWAHEFTTFPYKLFWWQSPDGSRILTYFPHDYAGGIEAEKLATDVSQWIPSMYGPQLRDNPEMMHLYGVGDHGGGPTRTMLDNADRLMSPNVVFPKFELSTATAFFNDLDKKLPEMSVPTWNDELYFQYHRGVFTTQAETKRRIRRSEEAVLNAEKFSSIASLYGRAYPQEEFQLAWKQLLFDHFHDIMPGSGIAVNYLDAKRNLEDVQRMSAEITRGSLSEISAHINTVGDGVPIIIFNPLSWNRQDVVEIEAQLSAPAQRVEVIDSTGNQAQSQLLSMDAVTHRVRLLLLADVPSLGYKTYFVRVAKSSGNSTSTLTASATTLENEFFRLKIDTHTGCVTSLFDKRGQTEALAPAETDTGGPKDKVCGNLLQTFVDKPKQWDAWNIDADFEQQHWDLDTADGVELIESGPLRAVIRVKNHFQNSTFVRDITMYAGVPRIDVKMHADWHEKHILLKVAFPLSAHNEKATFEIPFGSVQRPTTRRTPAEQAEFEVPAQRWGDISDATHGFSLLNDCKYGYDAKGNVLRLSLLRSPEWPDPHADEGAHDFTYSLYAHGGNWKDAQTVRRGYELNYPPVAYTTAPHEGELPADQSFLQVNADDVVVTALKRSEDDKTLVARFYEWAGKKTDVQLHFAAAMQAASETNLMEEPAGELATTNGDLVVHTSPYEIKTVRVSFDSRH
ncbi:MAG TPA: alpha-mannosidase [Terriglobales bacterium]|nr:alpha-mannosidase [Terriglobales bacterium]